MAINAITAIISLSLAGLIFYGPWQDVCTAWARQIVFEKRDALFNLAAKGQLSFDSTEYRTIRICLERSIRFAHVLTFWRLIIARRQLMKSGFYNRKSELQVAIEGIKDVDTRAEVAKLLKQANEAYLLMMVFKSVPLLFLLVLGAMAYMCSQFVDGFSAKVKSLRDNIESTSGEIIQLEAQAACG